MGLLLKRNPTFDRALAAFFFFGTFQGLILFLPNLLLFEVLPKEDLVGYLGALTSGITIVTGYIISRKAKEEKARLYVMCAAIGLTAASLLLLAEMSVGTVVGFMLVYSIFFPLLGNTMSTSYYRLIGQLPLKGLLRIESVVIREVYVNAGRVAAIFALIWFADDMEAAVFPWIIIAASLLQLAIIWLMDQKNVT